MNPEAEDFQALRRLIALKRYEQPPPGYFRQLPDKIALRIERGDAQLNLWERFLAGFAFRPAFAYGFAAITFGALTFNLAYLVRTASLSPAPGLADNAWHVVAPAQPVSVNLTGEPLHVANWMGDTNPSAELPSLFATPAQARVTPAAFHAGAP
jgi:hypothetical protein